MSGHGTDVADLLRGFAAQHERAANAQAPDAAAEVLALAARVRRRRMVRSSAVVAAGAAAALVGSVAVWGVTRPDPVVPAPQPTQSTSAPSPTVAPPAPSPDPTASSEPTAPTGVTVHTLLPKVEPMRRELWAQTDDSWVLGRYQGSRAEADGSSVTSPTVLYLVDPDGRTYEVPVPASVREVDGQATDWELKDWLPGQSRAVLRLFPAGDGDGSEGPPSLGLVVVDLATGEELVTYDVMDDRVLLLPEDRTLVARPATGDAQVVQVHDRDGYHLSEIGPFRGPQSVPQGWAWSASLGLDPTRTQLGVWSQEGLAVVDLATGRSRAVPVPPAPATAPCVPYSWLEKDRLVVRCAQVGAAEALQAATDAGDVTAVLGSDLWVVNLGDGSSRRLTVPVTPDGDQVTTLWQAGDHVVVARYGTAESCAQGLGLVARDGTQTPVGGVGPFVPTALRGDRLVGETWTCGTGDSSAFVQVDPGTGQVASIAPRVEGAQATFQPPAPMATQFLESRWTW